MPSGKFNVEGFSSSMLCNKPYFKFPSYVILFLKTILPGPCNVSYHNSLEASYKTAFFVVEEDIIFLSNDNVIYESVDFNWKF